MNKSLLGLIFIFITNFWIIRAQCPTGTTLNTQLECQCNTAGKYLDIDLAATLNALDTGTSSFTNIIPLYDFQVGTSGYSVYIGDYFNVTEGGGNNLGTDLHSELVYSQKTIVQSDTLGDGNSYFTAKFPGLFVFVGQINIEKFFIFGKIGTLDFGNKDAGELSATVNGINYKGFFTRTYGTVLPSVNHLIIVEDNGSLEHFYADKTSDDYDAVENLQNIPWLVYLLFSTWNGIQGTVVSNSIIQQFMITFLSSTLQKSDCTRSCPSACNTCISYFSCRECSSGKYLDGNDCKGTYFYCQ